MVSRGFAQQVLDIAKSGRHFKERHQLRLRRGHRNCACRAGRSVRGLRAATEKQLVARIDLLVRKMRHARFVDVGPDVGAGRDTQKQ